MTEAYVFLANGFEEIEALTVVDLLRRAGVSTQTVSISGERMVTGSHGIAVLADVLFSGIDKEGATLLVLPGGMPGTTNLGAHAELSLLLKEHFAKEKQVAAICAAPSVLGGLGILEGKTAVCYPGFEPKLTGATIGTQAVEVDGTVTTSRGMGTAIPFGLSLVAQLRGQETADSLAKGIIFS